MPGTTRPLRAVVLAKALALPLLVSFLAGGCAITPQETAYYRNEQIRNEQESVNYQLTYNTDANYLYFNEGNVNIRVRVFFDRVYNYGLVISNQTAQPMVVDWNRIEYVDAGAMSHSMIHEGVSYGDPVSAQKPTIIPPEGTIQDTVRPADRKMEDGEARLMEVAHTPPAQTWTDTTVIMLPIKVLGKWTRYQLEINVGEISPEVNEFAY